MEETPYLASLKVFVLSFLLLSSPHPNSFRLRCSSLFQSDAQQVVARLERSYKLLSLLSASSTKKLSLTSPSNSSLSSSSPFSSSDSSSVQYKPNISDIDNIISSAKK
jgi:hypothetical protein